MSFGSTGVCVGCILFWVLVPLPPSAEFLCMCCVCPWVYAHCITPTCHLVCTNVSARASFCRLEVRLCGRSGVKPGQRPEWGVQQQHIERPVCSSCSHHLTNRMSASVSATAQNTSVWFPPQSNPATAFCSHFK